jgi:hypothetical protein
MKRPTITPALGAALVLAGATAASAGAAGVVTPPAGTPNLALMVVQPTDLVPGAVIGDQAYVQPPSGFTADYGSDFTTASTSDGVNYSLVLDYVALAPDPTTADTLYAGEQAFEQSRKGRKFIVKSIIRAAGKRSHLKAKNVKFSAEQSAGVGQSSYEETITVAAKHIMVSEIYLIFQEGNVVASLELVSEADKPVPGTDATTLAAAMDSHIKSVLAASGATGATGTT